MPVSEEEVSKHRKACTQCSAPRDVLVRCQIDETGSWHFVCPGKCWKRVSGGVEDGDAEHPLYRYGVTPSVRSRADCLMGMWKNKHAGVSAKKPKKKKGTCESRSQPQEWVADGKSYTQNDRVTWDGKVWKCRRSHKSRIHDTPEKAVGCWKEDAESKTGSSEAAEDAYHAE
ncbi:hypothetical protein LTR66_001299 [Elasticomyces elasticus]|nr:hypothetical protein LTR66_001299 [Elasticomyces elasticus]